MPAYNSSKTIGESIDSVLKQSYTKWELIIVDDYSMDETKETINSYDDKRIRLYSNSYEKGAAGARRTAIDRAKGRYLAFLDSDDLWSGDKLEKHVSFMQGNNSAFTYSDYFCFKYNSSNIIKKIISPNVISYSRLLKSCDIGCLTVVIDRLKFVDLFYDNVPKEDYAFWLKLIKQCGFAYKVPCAYSYYRLSETSLSSNKFKEIIKQWYVLRRVEKQKIFSSIFYLMTYCKNGFFKHYGK